MAAPTDPFPSINLDAWRAQVLADLKGAAFEKRMFTSTFEGLTIPALSTGWIGPAEGTPVPPRPGPWQVVMAQESGEVGAAAQRVGEDLRGGADALWLTVGAGALPIPDREALKGLLEPVDLAAIPLHLGGPDAARVSGLLRELYTEKNVPAPAQRGSDGLDPLAWVEAGLAPVDQLDRLYDEVKLHLTAVPAESPREVLRIDGTLVHEAGASAVEELARGLLAMVSTLRALEARGVALEEVVRRWSWALGVGPDLYLGIATLRAARLLYAELAQAIGLPEQVTLHAISGRRAYAAVEPANNLLRATAMTFAAAIGGADRITIFADDAVDGPGSSAGQRRARNTQLILAHEAHLHGVVDPAGGSWFFEGITDQLAHRAWEAFQSLEQKGGLPKLLESGAWVKQVRRVGQERVLEARRRKTALVGISSYVDLAEAPLPKGAPKEPNQGLGLMRLAQPFEHFRRKGDAQLQKTGERPKVFLATLGPKKAHGARAQFTTQLLAAGGVVPVGQGPFDAGTVGPAFKESGAQVAVIASSDSLYEAEAGPIAQALKAAGAQVVLIAGRPGEHEDSWREAGVDSFLFLGCDVVELLDRLYAFIGAHS